MGKKGKIWEEELSLIVSQCGTEMENIRTGI